VVFRGNEIFVSLSIDVILITPFILGPFYSNFVLKFSTLLQTYSRSPISHDQETKNLVDSIKEVLLSSPKDYSTETPSTTKEL
jgi:hypothetical protein